MRPAHQTPPIALYLPDGLVAAYVPQSEPPAYRMDEIGADLPVDVTIPEDLVAVGWYWHGSLLAWNGGDALRPVGIYTGTFPPPGWGGALTTCFDAAREMDKGRAGGPVNVKQPAKKKKATQAPAGPRQLRLFDEAA